MPVPLTFPLFQVYEPVIRISSVGGCVMKTALRVAALVLTAVVGLWVLIRGIVIAVSIRALPGEHVDVLGHLVEASVFIAGGVCVLSVAVEQLNCLRTHRKDDSLI